MGVGVRTIGQTLPMPTVWIIRGGGRGQLVPAFERHGLVGLGWADLVGDLRRFSRWEIVGRLEQAGLSSGMAEETAEELILFRDQVMVGDVVVTPDTQHAQILVGAVTGPYEHLDPTPLTDDDDGDHRHVRTVAWWGRGDRRDLAEHLRKDLGGRRPIRRLPGTGEWARIATEVRDAPPKPPRAARSASDGSSGAPRARRVAAPKAVAPPKPPTDQVCPRCGLRKAKPQFIPGSEVCADCRADE